jgi:hypothetical protein
MGTVFLKYYKYVCLFSWRYNPVWLYFHSPVAGLTSSFSRFLDHTQRRATVRRTPLDEWSIRRRDLYLPTHNTHNRQTSMPPVGFEPTISAGERPKTYAYWNWHFFTFPNTNRAAKTQPHCNCTRKCVLYTAQCSYFNTRDSCVFRNRDDVCRLTMICIVMEKLKIRRHVR